MSFSIFHSQIQLGSATEPARESKYRTGSDSDRTQASATFKKHAIDEHSCTDSQRTEDWFIASIFWYRLSAVAIAPGSVLAPPLLLVHFELESTNDKWKMI